MNDQLSTINDLPPEVQRRMFEDRAKAERDEVMRMTLEHVWSVANNLERCSHLLMRRAINHDASKFTPEEWPGFADATMNLRGLTYGSPEYKAELDKMRPTIDLHYKRNSHHPEHYANGIDGMCLLDLVEMLCDWRAATQRHADGDLRKSLVINQERFRMSPQLVSILKNTAVRLGWIDSVGIGDAVTIHSHEGFGGPAKIVEQRERGEPPYSRFKVEMLDGSQPKPFWAFDHEIEELNREANR